MIKQKFRKNLGSELLVEDWNVVIVFGLEEISEYWSSQSMFLDEGSSLPSSSFVSRSVRQMTVLGVLDASGLLVDEVDVTMKTGIWWWSCTDVLGKSVSL
ncbi:hypothetical protein GCK72_019359 [Caenorhabditis remanei]|uniref:Uncharacterized protein n=1 Tax=Caenorhabditis remanei TaxID=31234 RepID=A0A6A5GDJ4_CAERE|nr:hypothetical protein GCK72_019359 [Caenorhabditis remanei]KAF1752804.1 hypothetical protein GCK72_019359 [Caenorhabditis remanei]